jgi:hypothetical protein
LRLHGKLTSRAHGSDELEQRAEERVVVNVVRQAAATSTATTSWMPTPLGRATADPLKLRSFSGGYGTSG